MRCSKLPLIALLAASALGALAQAAGADKKDIKPTNEWSGSVDDADLWQKAPQFVAAVEDLEKLWKDWKLADKPPKVDFTKEIVVIVTSRGSKLQLSEVTLDDDGNLQVLAMGTLDRGPGFRYVLATVPRAGVKKVNGKELK